MLYKIIINNQLLKNTISNIIKIIRNEPNNKYYKIINDEKILINNKIVCNTQFICHRINSSEELKDIDNMFGVELDIRDDHKSGKLILAHDPFVNGECFEDYLPKYNHNTLILNIKSERVEIECLNLMNKFNITNYFFLDSSFPMINLLNKKYSCDKIASRYSEYECFEFTENIQDMIQWVWVDCFTKLPLDTPIYEKIQKINKKLCIVSPDLQGQPDKINKYRQQLLDNNTIPNAICCKKYNIYKWI